MHVTQRRFQRARRCIVRVQALRKGCAAQTQFQALRHAAITLQVYAYMHPKALRTPAARCPLCQSAIIRNLSVAQSADPDSIVQCAFLWSVVWHI